MINRREFLTTLGISGAVPAKSAQELLQFISSQIPGANEPLGIDLAGDARGNIIGIVWREEGKAGIPGASTEIAGTTPTGPWKRTARTRENGVFVVEIPYFSVGTIDVTATKDGQTATSAVDVQDLSIGLTPRPMVGSAKRLSLNGTWQFALDPPADFLNALDSQVWHEIKVPAHWEMEGFTSETGKALYKKTLTLPSGWKGQRIKFRAEAIYSSCEIFVNAQRVGRHEGGATPFEIDLTQAIKFDSENTILVLVHARSKSHDLDMASFFAYFELAGIWQPVEVFATEPVHISRLAYVTTFDEDYHDAVLTVDIDAVNEQSVPVRNAKVKLTLLDPAGKSVRVDGLAAKIDLGPWERKKLLLNAKVLSPKCWHAEQPTLYTLSAHVSVPEQSPTSVETRVGFRTIEIRGNTYLLNGKAIKLKGVCRLESDPLLGRALTDQLSEEDVKLMKAANFNAFRATIFPPHSAALDSADELGLYVEEEGPATFVSMGWFNAMQRGNSSDLRYAPMYAGIMSEMIERDRNHPSVIYYSICNESRYGLMFQVVRDVVHTSDPSRPSSATWVTVDPTPGYPFGGREDDYGADIAVLHHPITVDRIRKMANHPRPLLFDEVLGVFHGFEDLASALDLDPGMRDFWVTGIPAIMTEIRGTPNCLGSMQFAWTDDKFLVPGKGISSARRGNARGVRYIENVYKMPGRGILGEVAWGILDGWRRPRPEFWLSKKIYSPIHIEEKPLECSSPILVSVQNLNSFVNLDQYTCKWTLAEEGGEVTPSIEPGSTGMLTISVKTKPRLHDVLLLEFRDWRGELVDAYNLRFCGRETSKWTNSGKPARIVEQNLPYMNESDPICLAGQDSGLSYDRTNGELRWALAGHEQVINLGPVLHVLRSMTLIDLDYPAGWKLVDETHTSDANQAVLNLSGSFGTEFRGGYQITMDDAGNAEFHYSFKYSGLQVYAREIGLRFKIPLPFDKLTWNRRAEFSYYPADHIGRPSGEAVAHPNINQTVPPGARPYSLDDHPWGCNDFRSAKRNIYEASLTNPSGQGIRIFSDGSQHVRAMMGVHDITVNVLDFYGGAGPRNSWSDIGFHYGAGKLINTGDTLKGVVKVQLLVGSRQPQQP